MNKLQKLLATKAEIEAELEKERKEKIDAENKARAEKFEKVRLDEQYQIDGIQARQVKEIYDLISSKFYVDEKTLWVISAILFIARKEISQRDLLSTLDSINRFYLKEKNTKVK